MAASNYARSLQLVLQSEGGYVNHPLDPGGATNYGITQRVYDGFRYANGKNKMPVKLIGKDEVAAIYRLQYWEAIKGDDLPPGIDYCTFDAAVNSGPVRAAKWLQKAIPTVPIDGHIGLGTVNAARGSNDRVAVVRRYCAMRLSFLHQLKQWFVFGKGWANRMKTVQATAEAMAAAG